MKLVRVILVVAFALLSDRAVAQEFDLDASIRRGSTVYSSNCSSCHMFNGTGIQGVYPPLTGADSLINDLPRLVKSILEGVQGPTVVNGVDYDGEMESYALTDRQVSDLLNYIRNSWGNEGEAILPEQIQPALQKSGEDN